MVNRKAMGDFPTPPPWGRAAAVPRADAVISGLGVARSWPHGRIRASQLTDKSAVLKEAAASGKVSLL
jgi:hypothetical protein